MAILRGSEAVIHEPTTPDHAGGGGRAADAVAGGERAADAARVWHACEDYATAEALWFRVRVRVTLTLTLTLTLTQTLTQTLT